VVKKHTALSFESPLLAKNSQTLAKGLGAVCLFKKILKSQPAQNKKTEKINLRSQPVMPWCGIERHLTFDALYHPLYYSM